MAGHGEVRPDIILNSPVGSKPAVYKWPLTYVSKGQKIDGAEEIIETIRWVAREYLEFKPAIENLLHDQLDFKSYDCIKGLCDKYNKITDFVMKMNKGTSIALKTSSRASQGLLKHIIQQVYNYAVDEPNELNKYSPFSSETYGETSFEFMAQLIDKNQFKPREQDTFIDLGSGVGHLVLQMAASVKCKKCYGIEIADVPAGYAKLMEERFKFWMNWHGKTYTEFELYHGDFFEKKYTDIIKNSTFILVNNFAFKPDVDHKLKQRFSDLKDGAQILSSKPFCSPKSRVTERNLTDIGSMMHVVEIQPEQKKDTVSWTPKPLPYYLHVLDGSRIERYYERQKRRQGRSMKDERGRPTKRRKTGKAASDSFSDESEDNTVYGPTTRKAWSEWCNQTSVSASNRTSTDSVKTTTSSRNNSTDTENISEDAIDDNTTATSRLKEEVGHSKRDKKHDTQSTDNQETSAQGNARGQSSNQAPKSCLDKKRDYAIKKTSGTSFLQNAPSSTLYSISKPPDTSNGQSSNLKIPNIVIKVKPPIEAKVVSESAKATTANSSNRMSSAAAAAAAAAAINNATAETPKPETKVNDENGKKLRQRKKPVTAQPAPPPPTTTTKPTKSSESKNANSILGPTTNGTRGRKAGSQAQQQQQQQQQQLQQPQPQAAPTTKASGKATGGSKKKAATSPDKNQSLDLLHAKTVESVSSSSGYYLQPAPGCEDHNLKSITDTPSLPKVVIKDLSMFIAGFLGPKNIERFIASTNQEFDKFAKKIQHPNAKESLIRSIEQERLRNRELLRAEDGLLRHVRFLNDRIPKVMKAHCDELGIRDTNRSIVHHLGALLKKHQDLSNYQFQLENDSWSKTMNPPAAHSNSNQPRTAMNLSATLDLSLK